jgi:hypothetical protein
MISLTHAFGFSREPFAQDIPVKDLFQLSGLSPFLNRFEYAVFQFVGEDARAGSIHAHRHHVQKTGPGPAGG